MRTYKVLQQQVFTNKNYSLVPIRNEDRYNIMKWRNDQLFHLRQSEPLTREKQDDYFINVVANLFDQEQPDQILFSFLENDICIGYGGLVHINWIDKNAEISFIMDTILERESFNNIWISYIELIEKIAFEELKLHKLYVYAFDVRPHLYRPLKHQNYFFDARLKDHCFFEGEFKDVVIYSKLKRSL